MGRAPPHSLPRATTPSRFRTGPRGWNDVLEILNDVYVVDFCAVIWKNGSMGWRWAAAFDWSIANQLSIFCCHDGFRNRNVALCREQQFSNLPRLCWNRNEVLFVLIVCCPACGC